ncbi:MAG: hypothetical protein FJ286_00710 [Planctomycetes bacterium]|nr:hypothetical protein [Planctomycetota bacterium]
MDRDSSAAARPRNFLAPPDRRRLFWSVMPAAAAIVLGLGWIERTWFAAPQRPIADEVDTRLDAVAGPPPAGDEIVIEPEGLPLDAPPAAALSASREALARVRDATFFRAADEEAWFQTWNTLRAAGLAAFRRAGPQPVAFRELFGQPRSFRGRLVAMRGTLHRLEELPAPANDHGVERYWQGWLEPEGGPSSPVVVQALRLPAGMPTGLSIDEPVEVIGYFFKNYAYNAADTIRVAPVIMAVEPIRRPRPVAPAGGGTGSTVLTTLLAATLVSLIGAAWVGSRATRRPVPSSAMVDLDAVLSVGAAAGEATKTTEA